MLHDEPKNGFYGRICGGPNGNGFDIWPSGKPMDLFKVPDQRPNSVGHALFGHYQSPLLRYLLVCVGCDRQLDLFDSGYALAAKAGKSRS